MECVRSTATTGRIPEATRFIPADNNGYVDGDSSGYVEDHFPCQSDRKRLAGNCNDSDSTRCGCSRCRTRYLVSCSAYENGSYWLSPIEGYREEYTFSPARKPST